MKKPIVLIIASLTLLSVLAATTYFYRAYISSTDSANISPAALIQRIEKHILLPTTTPKVGTVVDVEKLRATSTFFNDAKNGNRVLIYPDRAIIYDIKLDKIINVGIIPNLKKPASESATMK